MATKTFTRQAIRVPTLLERAKASAINNAQSLSLGITTSGLNKRVPLLYGETRIPGIYLTRPVIYSSQLVFAIGWSEGEIEGVQTVYMNEAAMPGSGVTITHYTGTDSQTVDATLAAAIPGFDDAFVGVAYSVFSIAASAVNGWPRIEAVVRGIKCVDPRGELTAYTTNPALHLLDFCTRAGKTASGIIALADFCETDYEADVRSEAGLWMNEPLTFEQGVDVLTTYAEALWAYEGDGIIVVPDTIVETMPVYGCGDDFSIVDGIAIHTVIEGQEFTAPPVGVTIDIYEGEVFIRSETLRAGQRIQITG